MGNTHVVCYGVFDKQLKIHNLFYKKKLRSFSLEIDHHHVAYYFYDRINGNKISILTMDKIFISIVNIMRQWLQP